MGPGEKIWARVIGPKENVSNQGRSREMTVQFLIPRLPVLIKLLAFIFGEQYDFFPDSRLFSEQAPVIRGQHVGPCIHVVT